MTEIKDWQDPVRCDGSISVAALFLNQKNGWDKVFPKNMGSTEKDADPYWTDPENNVSILRSEIIRYGFAKLVK